MKITRNGQDFELTRSELSLAHEEYEHLLYVDSIKDNISSEYYVDLKESATDETIENAAYELQRLLDQGYDYGVALHSAMEIALCLDMCKGNFSCGKWAMGEYLPKGENV